MNALKPSMLKRLSLALAMAGSLAGCASQLDLTKKTVDEPEWNARRGSDRHRLGPDLGHPAVRVPDLSGRHTRPGGIQHACLCEIRRVGWRGEGHCGVDERSAQARCVLDRCGNDAA